MKPGHVATSAVDYLARKKGLVLNSADISNTIIANVDAAEHRGVAVPPGTPEGYVLTVNENNKSGWKISKADLLLTSPNRWTLQQEFKTPPIVNYEYANLTETSNQVITTEVAHTIVNNKFSTITLANVLNVNPIGGVGQQIHLRGDSTMGVYSSSQILFTYRSDGDFITDPIDPTPIYPSLLVDRNIIGVPVDGGDIIPGDGIIVNPGDGIIVSPGDGDIVNPGDGNIVYPYDPEKTTSYSNNAIISNDLYTISSTQGINIEGQVTFNTPPRAPKPIIGNDVATKSYVDTLVGNYSGSGLNLYMNEGILSPALTTGSQVVETSVYDDTFITEFITEMDYPNMAFIPSGLWSMTLYGKISDDTIDTRYYFEVYKVSGNTYTWLITSMVSEYINTISSTPDAYHINVPFIDNVPLNITDRLAVRLYATSSAEVTITTYFGGMYYSFISTSITGGLSIVSMNNTFSGDNIFASQIKANGGITTTTLYGTTLTLTYLVGDTIQANNATITGAINATDIQTTTLQTTGLITAHSINVTGLTTNGISTTNLRASGLVYAQGGLTTTGLTATGISATNLRVTNLVYVGDVTTGGLTATGISTTNLRTTELIYTGGIFTGGITATGISTTNLRATQLVYAEGGISTAGLTATGISTTDLRVSNLVYAEGGLTTGGITATGISTTNLRATQLVYAGELTTTGLTATGISATNLRVSEFIYAGGIFTGGITATGISTTNLRADGFVYASGITATGISATNLRVDGLVYAGGLTTGGITATGISTTNLTVDGLVYAGGISTGGLTATGISTTNLYATTLSITNYSINELICQNINAGVNTDSVSLYTSTPQITLGSPTSMVQVSNLIIQDTAIESSIPTSGTITIGASQITGSINIGTNGSRTGEINIGNNGNSINIKGALTLEHLLEAPQGITSTSIYTTTLTVTNSTDTTFNTLVVDQKATCAQLIISDIPTNLEAVGYREVLNLGSITFNTGTSAKTAKTFLSGNLGGLKGVWIYEISFTYTTSSSVITTSFSTTTAMNGQNSVAYNVVANSANTYVTTMSLDVNRNVYLVYTNSSSSQSITSNPTTFIATRIA